MRRGTPGSVAGERATDTNDRPTAEPNGHDPNVFRGCHCKGTGFAGRDGLLRGETARGKGGRRGSKRDVSSGVSEMGNVQHHEPWERQQVALVEFWGRAKVSPAIVDRLGLLQEFAERFVVPVKAYRQVRKNGRTRGRIRYPCWACRNGKSDVRHHIVQVQHGGTNAKKNRVPLCHGCHRVVHPWLRKR